MNYRMVILMSMILGCFIWGAMRWRENRYWSDAQKVRESSIYPRLIQPLPSSAVDAATLPEVVVRENDITVTSGSIWQGWTEKYPFHLQRATNGQKVAIGQGQIRLAGVDLNYWTGKKHQRTERIVESLTKGFGVISDGPIIAERLTNTPGMEAFPRANFYFETENVPALEFVDFHIVDRTTKWLLNSPSEIEQRRPNAGLHLSLPVYIWRPAPVEAFLTFATDRTSLAIPLGQSNKVDIKGGAFKVTVVPGHGIAMRMRSFGKSITQQQFERVKGYGYKPNETVVILQFTPSLSHSLVHTELINSEGHIVDPIKVRKHDTVQFLSYRGTVSDVSEVRLTWFENIHRVSFELQELPNLPNQNRGLENLFDTIVPYTVIHAEGDYGRVLSPLIGAFLYKEITLDFALYPQYYTNVTVREIFEDFQKLGKTNGRKIVYDPRTNRIEQKPSFLLQIKQELFEKLK